MIKILVLLKLMKFYSICIALITLFKNILNFQRCCRDHSNKLDLDALLISPIQRIPRYELLVKQLLKHTPAEHADRERLLCVQRHIHKLAVIN